MKKRYYILFIALFLSILGAYLLCITHIDIFITDYNDKIMSYENNFNAENQYNNIIGVLFNEGESQIEVSTTTDLEEIVASDYLLSIISYTLNLPKNSTVNYLKKAIDMKTINTIYSKHYEEKIIYMSTEKYALVFTMDGKNIYYNFFLSGETCKIDNIEESTPSIDTISSNVYKIVNDLSIKSNIGFDITSIRKAYTSEYYELYGSVYLIEDKTHNIKITYQLDCDIIYILQVGFEFLEAYY